MYIGVIYWEGVLSRYLGLTTAILLQILDTINNKQAKAQIVLNEICSKSI